ncbi:MAG: SGNH/GDSL hydrolase family protein [Planctomycetota bacterium]
MKRRLLNWVVLALAIALNSHGAETGVAFVKALDTGKKQTLVVYGTSLTAAGAWVKQLQDTFNTKHPGLFTIINSAQSGQHSSWGLQNVKTRVIDKKPDAVLIEFGINDAVLRFNISIADCRANVTKMLDAIHTSLPNCEIILMTMNCAAGDGAAKRGDKVNDYYQVYRDIAAERKLLLIDHYTNWKAIQDKDAKQFSKLVPDGIHPSAVGAKDVILPEFERVFLGKK